MQRRQIVQLALALTCCLIIIGAARPAPAEGPLRTLAQKRAMRSHRHPHPPTLPKAIRK